MNRRKFLKLAGTFGAGVAAGGLIKYKSIPEKLIKYSLKDGKYDFDDILIDDLDSVLYDAIEYKTLDGIFEGYGLGFYKGNKLITAAHILNNETQVFLNNEELEVIHKDRENDIAIIDVPQKYILHEPKLGNSDELEVGNVIVAVGIPKGVRKIARLNRIVAEDGCDCLLTGRHVGKENEFLIWGILSPGDSGGPVFAFRDGEPEIVGMMKSLYGSYGECHKINHILEKTKKYL